MTALRPALALAAVFVLVGAAAATDTLTRAVQPAAASPAALPAGIAGAHYDSGRIEIQGGKAPYYLSDSSGIPAGLFPTLTAAGEYRIAGTPPSASNTQVVQQVTDSTGRVFHFRAALAIAAPPPATNVAANPAR